MADLVGCDLEYALKTPNGYMPAGILPIKGVKGYPEQIGTGGVEIDCCAVELTMPPSANKNQWIETIVQHLENARKRYADYGELVCTPSIYFDPVNLKKAKFANVMGCVPDWNVYTRQKNPPPHGPACLRSFGGHIHISKGSPDTVKACDLTLGMWSVVKDLDTDRRKLYGKAGAFRPKEYGIEYRVLSNFWCGDKVSIAKVWDLVELAREITPKVDELIKIVGGEQEVQNIINQSRAFDARSVLESLGVNIH